MKGRTANVIGSFWNGKNVLKIRTASYTDANSQQQQNQRSKFVMVNAFASLNKNLIRIGFSAIKNSASTHNRAIKYNFANVVTGEYPNFKLDLNLARISIGDLENLKMPVVSSPEKGIVQIDWIDNSGSGLATGNDYVYFSLMNESAEDAFINDTVVKRRDKSAIIELPGKWSGKSITVLGFTASEKVIVTAKTKSQISDSSVYGTVEVL